MILAHKPQENVTNDMQHFKYVLHAKGNSSGDYLGGLEISNYLLVWSLQVLSYEIKGILLNMCNKQLSSQTLQSIEQKRYTV